MNTGEILEIINQLEFFSDFPLQAKQDIARISSLTNHSIGEQIIKEGEIGDNLYILVEGSLKVYKNKVRVGTIEEKGTLLGEIGFASEGHRRSAMVVARDETLLLSFQNQRLTEILGLHSPSIILTCLTKIAKNNISKIETTNQNIATLVEKRHALRQTLKASE